MTSMAEMATILLAPKDRDAVLGDLAEMGATGWSAIRSVLGLVVRQQMELWRAWQPWVTSSMAFIGSWLLLSVSFGLSMDSRHLLHGERGYGSMLCATLLMLSWAWTSGFVVGSLSGRTRWVSGILCAIPCLSCVLRFQDTSISRLCVLLFLLPGVVGAVHGARRARLSHRTSLTLAIGTTVLMLLWGGMYVRNWFFFLPAWWLGLMQNDRNSPTKRNRHEDATKTIRNGPLRTSFECGFRSRPERWGQEPGSGAGDSFEEL